MIETTTGYVFQTPDGGWRLTGSRINLDSVIDDFNAGKRPTETRDDFPSLSLEQIYGAIAFYLHNKDEMDRYLKDQEAWWEELRKQSEAAHGDLFREMRARSLSRIPPEQVP